MKRHMCSRCVTYFSLSMRHAVSRHRVFVFNSFYGRTNVIFFANAKSRGFSCERHVNARDSRCFSARDWVWLENVYK